MSKDPATGVWSKTVKLRVGGPLPLPAVNSISGAYQYKFYSDGNWLPNSTPALGIISSRFSEISAYIFPDKNSSVDTSSIKIIIDEIEYTGTGHHYDPTTKLISFFPPQPLNNGLHKLMISAMSSLVSINSDSTTFTVQGGMVQFLIMTSETWKFFWRLQGAIFNSSGEIDASISTAQINRYDSFWTVQVNDGLVILH